MKEQDFSKKTIIRHESELVAQFRALVCDDPDLRWALEPVKALTSGNRGESLSLEFDGNRFEFHPLYALKPSVSWLQGLSVLSSLPQPLVVTPELSPRIVATCKERGVAAIDLNGRTWLRARGLLVDRRPLPGRSFRYELEPQNIFVGKSARIIRYLLTDRDGIRTQKEIVAHTGGSSALVSRIVQYLIRQGFAEKINSRNFRLCDWNMLLDAWVESDNLLKRTRLTHYAGIDSTQELAYRIQEWAESEKVPIAFTQWIAAWSRHPHTEPMVCSAYISRLPEADALNQWRLRKVEDGGKLWLFIPDDEGVLTEIQTRKRLNLVTDAQIYLDLQRTGLRGPEAALALREWEGFCRP